MGRLDCECENLCIYVCVSLLPDVFWTVTLNDSKYSVILERLREIKTMLWQTLWRGGEGGREGEKRGGWITHAFSFALHCGPCWGKRRQTAVQRFRATQLFYTLLTFNRWHNKQPLAALHGTTHKAITHTHTHTQVCNAAECDASNAVNREVKAEVVKWRHSRQLLLLPHCDYCINH